MSSSALYNNVFQAKIGNVQNQADSSSVYSAGVWSFKNSTALTSVTITDSGNVGIGTSSPSTAGGYSRTIHMNANGNYGQLRLEAVNGSDISFTTGATTYAGIGADSTAGANGFLLFRTNGSERMRIDASGRLLIGATGPLAPSGNDNTAKLQVTGHITSTAGYVTRAGSGGATANLFNIYWTGSAQLWIDTTNVGTITLTSDYRIKKNVETQELPALERIAQLRPVKYEYTDYKELYKADGVQREGFIAHELQAVIPSAVEGQKDDENQIQSLKLDALCSVMVKAIQELSAKNEALEARLAALEAK